MAAFSVTTAVVVWVAPCGLRATIVTFARTVWDFANSFLAFAVRCSEITLTLPPTIVNEPLASVRIAFFAVTARAERAATAVRVFSVTVPEHERRPGRAAQLEAEGAVARDRERRPGDGHFEVCDAASRAVAAVVAAVAVAVTTAFFTPPPLPRAVLNSLSAPKALPNTALSATRR